MSFFNASKKADDVKQGGSNYITASGVYPVTILAPIVSVSDKGSQTVDLFVEHQGQKQIIYGNLRLTNNDGGVNKIGSRIFNQMVIIAGLDEISEPVEAELPIGKDGKMKDCAVLEDLVDLDILMRIQMEYSVWKGNIIEKKVIKAFFRSSDKATAEEIVNDEEPGKGFEREEKYLDAVTYQDGLTAESVQEWIKAGRPKGTGKAAANGGGGEKAPSFGTRRFGKSED